MRIKKSLIKEPITQKIYNCTGVSQRDLATLAGVNASTLNRFQSATRDLPSHALLTIAVMYDDLVKLPEPAAAILPRNSWIKYVSWPTGAMPRQNCCSKNWMPPFLAIARVQVCCNGWRYTKPKPQSLLPKSSSAG